MTCRIAIPLLLSIVAPLLGACAGGDVPDPAGAQSAELAVAADADADADADVPMLPPLPPGPPPEAIEACASREDDAACAFAVADHRIEGTCRAGPSADMPLACAPEEPPMPPPPPRRPPPQAFLPPMGGPPREAVDACAGLPADHACSFASFDRAIDGRCWAPPGLTGVPLACAPAHVREGR